MPEAKTQDASTAPPLAAVRPVELEKHGDVRVDDYYWLRERDDPDVIAYLEAENAYTAAQMAHTEALQERLFEEIKGRIVEDDESVPYRLDGYFYYVRMETGKAYPIYCRKKASPDRRTVTGDEEILVDVNGLAEGEGFMAVRGVRPSRSQQLLVFGMDNVGRRFYTLRFKDLRTGELLPDTIPETTGSAYFAADNQTVFYSKQHPETLRSYRVYRHHLGTDPADDVLVYEEPDETFYMGLGQTKSREYLLIASTQTLRTEYRYLRADEPEGEFQVFHPREGELEYYVDHAGDRFYIRTNRDGRNFHLMSTPASATGKENWQEIVPHRDDVFLEGFEVFKEHLVVAERRSGLVHLRIRRWDGSDEHEIDVGEPAYVAYPTTNLEFGTDLVRYAFSSPRTPRSTFDYDMETRERVLLKQEKVLGGFDPADYETERLHAPARDGEMVPVSLVYRRGLKKDGSNPVLLYAYGSYGASMDAGWSSERVSLLDRGFVYAIAHVRGGQELGYRWYELGKLLNKKNTFTDFIDSAEFLMTQGYTSPEHLYARGGSAGGLLMGAIVNMRPELFNGVIAAVPFVDVITTMLDASIPLTSGEWDEWGNPQDRRSYDYMLSYSPYDNVEAKEYPNLLVTTGLHDSQVQYWEPAKWVAKLRAKKTGDQRLLLKTNMEAGHGGASGRYRRYRETAFDYAFLLDLEGLVEAGTEASG